jgi:hypothetical protein
LKFKSHKQKTEPALTDSLGFLVRVVGFAAFFLAAQEKIKDAARKHAARVPLAL